MKPESEIFRYQKGKKIGEIVTIVSIIVLIMLILDSEGSKITMIFLMILMAGFLVLMIGYSYLLNKNFEITSELIIINKRLGKSIKIPFSEIRRVTIREEENSVEMNHFAMTIFGRSNNTRIIISDLDDRFKMINLIEQKGKYFGFNVIHQELEGKIIRDLRE